MSLIPDEDIPLVIRYQNGNHGSLEVLYRKYKNKLLKLIWYYVNRLDDAEDVLQTLFLKLIGSLKKYKIYPKVKFKTWLYRVAINTAKDYIKKRKEVLLKMDMNEWPSPMHMAHEEVEKKEMVYEIRRHVGQLPLKYKEVIIMIYFEHLSYQEAAGILHRPIGTIKSRTNYALHLLKKRMKKYI